MPISSSMVRGALIAVTFAIMPIANSAAAQNPSTQVVQRPSLEDRQSPADSAAAVAAAAIADTGRMMPPYRDISRYDTPGYCVAGMINIGHETWRKHERDTLEVGSPHDSLAPAALAFGRRCAAKFTVQTTDPHELYNLMRLSIMLGDEAKAISAVNRRVTLATTPQTRADMFLDAMKESLDAQPAQYALARTMLTRMDSLGTTAPAQRVEGHAMMLRRAERDADTTAVAREGKVLRQIATLLTPQETAEHYEDVIIGMSDSVYIVSFRHMPNFAAEVARYVQRDYVPKMRANGAGENEIRLVVAAFDALASSVGTPAPPVSGKYIFNPGPDKVKPAPGKVTLLLEVPKGDGTMGKEMAMLRRLYTRYASQGLEIVLVEKTLGYSWSSPPQTPEQEAASDAWYYLQYLKLPFTLIVDETPFKHLPDGRRVNGVIPFEEQYRNQPIIVGRDGKIFAQWMGVETEARLDRSLRDALAVKGSE